jgi:glycosyltransferase involved in cell wall biosynthesis
MKVLIVCSYNSGTISPFIKEQVDSLKEIGVESGYFKVQGKGLKGYLKNLKPLNDCITNNNYDLIHAHYGFCGMLANLQNKLPVITTYHGSDIHFFRNRMISLISSRLSEYNILTNKKQIEQIYLRNNYKLQPCGVDTTLFHPMEKSTCREKLELSRGKKIILFSSSFNNKVKNVALAQKAINRLKDVSLIELKGYSRQEVALLINASDAVLITSFYETGPLIAKEALACNTPVVSTDVGDVKWLMDGLEGCYIAEFEKEDVAAKIEKAICFNQEKKHTKGRERMIHLGLDSKSVAENIIKVYQSVTK